MFGNPQTGLRRFTVYRNMAIRCWRRSLPRPVLLFGSQCVLDKHVFFGASDADVRAMLGQLRVKRGFAKDDESIVWKGLLPACQYKHLVDVQRDVLPSLEDPKNVTFHCDQTRQWGLVKGPLARRLLTRTIAYSMLLDRFQLPSEAMMQMGMPAAEEPRRSLLETSRPAIAREIAGNGLHPAAYAAVLFSLLTTAV